MIKDNDIQFVDFRFLDNIEKSGLLKELYR